jgi:hypothetical protein
LGEYSRIQESSKYVPYLNLVFGDGQREVEVTTEAESLEELFKSAHTILDEWLSAAHGEHNVGQVAYVGAVPVTEQVPVAERDPVPTLGVSTDSNLDATRKAMIEITQIMTLEDLALVSEIVLDELRRRTRPDYGNTLVPEKLEIVDEITRSPASTGPSGFGYSVTNY